MDKIKFYKSIQKIAVSHPKNSENFQMIRETLNLFELQGVNKNVTNRGPSEINTSELSKTALMHKAMFDFMDSKSTAQIFARGIHSNLFCTEFVLSAVEAYVKRFLDDASNSDGDIPITVISKDAFTTPDNYYKNIRSSKFVKKLRLLEYEYDRKVLNIIEPKNSSISISDETIDLFKKSGITLEEILTLDNSKTDIKDISSFSIFGNSYRYRIDCEPQHKAILNLGNPNGVIALQGLFKDIVNSTLEPSK